MAPPRALPAPTETSNRIATVRDLLDKSKPQILMALPKHMTPDRMIRLAMTSILKNPKLLECDPRSLIGAVIQCAQLGLEPGSNYGAHLVPFWNGKKGCTDVQVIPDYRGLMALARNSEQISTIDAHEVYQKDDFAFTYGARPSLTHTPYLERDRGEIKAFYAIAVLKDGGVQFIVLQKWEVEDIRDQYAKGLGKGQSPWETNFPEMGKKSCVRRLSDYLPARIELLSAAGLEAKAEQGIPQDLGALVDTSDPELHKSLDRAAEGIEMGKAVGPYQEPKGLTPIAFPSATTESQRVQVQKNESLSAEDLKQAELASSISEEENDEALAAEARAREEAEATPPPPTPSPEAPKRGRPAKAPAPPAAAPPLSGPALRQACWTRLTEAAKAQTTTAVSLLGKMTGKGSLASLNDAEVKSLYDTLAF